MDWQFEGWPDRQWLQMHWPHLGAISSARRVGSGLQLTTDAGLAHVKKRPRQLIEAEVWILGQLLDQGLPVTEPQITATGARHAMFAVNDLDTQAVLVYLELPGLAWVDYGADDAPIHLAQLGEAAARLHRALADIDITEAIVRGLPVRSRRRGGEGLPVQIIHRDFHGGNVVFDHGRVSGYLDFDHLELGPRWVDPLYGSLSAMARLWEAGRQDEWLPLFEAMITGYHRVASITDREADRTVELMIGIEEDFLAHFLPDQDEANSLLTVRMINRVDQWRQRIEQTVARVRR